MKGRSIRMSLPRWTPDNIEKSVQTGRAVVVYLRADWCSQCKLQEPVLERLASEFADDVIVGSIDVGDNPGISDEYQIKGLPAFLMFHRGTYRSSLNGYKRAPELRAAISDLSST